RDWSSDVCSSDLLIASVERSVAWITTKCKNFRLLCASSVGAHFSVTGHGVASPQMRRIVHGTANTGVQRLSFARANAASCSLRVGPTRPQLSVQHCGIRGLEIFRPPVSIVSGG